MKILSLHSGLLAYQKSRWAIFASPATNLHKNTLATNVIEALRTICYLKIAVSEDGRKKFTDSDLLVALRDAFVVTLKALLSDHRFEDKVIKNLQEKHLLPILGEIFQRITKIVGASDASDIIDSIFHDAIDAAKAGLPKGSPVLFSELQKALRGFRYKIEFEGDEGKARRASARNKISAIVTVDDFIRHAKHYNNTLRTKSKKEQYNKKMLELITNKGQVVRDSFSFKKATSKKGQGLFLRLLGEVKEAGILYLIAGTASSAYTDPFIGFAIGLLSNKSVARDQLVKCFSLKRLMSFASMRSDGVGGGGCGLTVQSGVFVMLFLVLPAIVCCVAYLKRQLTLQTF